MHALQASQSVPDQHGHGTGPVEGGSSTLITSAAQEGNSNMAVP